MINKIRPFIRFIIAVVFGISGILKLFSLDSFEVYVYSFGILSLNQAFLLSRVIISIEMILAVMLILGIYQRTVKWTVIIISAIFSAFITYLIIVNSGDHCHCFGDQIRLSHPVSLIKNLIIILLTLFLKKEDWLRSKYKAYILSFIIAGGIAVPLIYSPPDFVRFESYSSMVKYDPVLLAEYIDTNNLDKGERVICFFGSSCRYCRLAAQKMKIISERGGQNMNILFVFWGSDESIASFLSETQTEYISYKTLEAPGFLRITNGKMPLIVSLSDGQVFRADNYRSIDEHDFVHKKESN